MKRIEEYCRQWVSRVIRNDRYVISALLQVRDRASCPYLPISFVHKMYTLLIDVIMTVGR